MSLTAAFASLFANERRTARLSSQRVEGNVGDEEALRAPSGTAPENVGSQESEPVALVDNQRGINESTTTVEQGNDASQANDDEGDRDDVRVAGNRPRVSRRTMTLEELEEERELARRRSSACVLLAVFILFQFWIEAIRQGSLLFLIFCALGTSWTARWIRYNREREEELDRRIAHYLEGNESGTSDVDRNDLRMLSFQAQLALAIMESQRSMMQGGFGNPDGPQNNNPGVTDEAKAKWDRFTFKTVSSSVEKTVSKGNYGSVAQDDQKGVEEEPNCSICLVEYEEGDKLVKLPCGHVYHEACIASWTSNHVKCPLCNYDLSDVEASPSSGDAAIV